MEVYIEFVYLSNLLLILLSLEMMAILLVKEISFGKLLQQSFFLSIGIGIIYFDYSFILFLVWLIGFYYFYRRQVFLFYPIFIFIYFSTVYFMATFIPEAFVYNGIIIAPLNVSGVLLAICAMLAIILQMMFVIYLKKKHRLSEYKYPMQLDYHGNKYDIVGFLDSGNEVYYQGYPLILLNTGVIDDYQVIDYVWLNDLKVTIIEIIKVEQVKVNCQILNDVYVGIIPGIKYDCLLNKVLMGGVL